MLKAWAYGTELARVALDLQDRGVDWIGVGRAVLLNFKAGRRTQGASTITQQLGRQSFELLDKSYGRKLTEAFLANRIDGMLITDRDIRGILRVIQGKGV